MWNGQQFAASAILGDQRLSNEDILRVELRRARHALAYLKQKLGNEAIRGLLKDDLAGMTKCVQAG